MDYEKEQEDYSYIRLWSEPPTTQEIEQPPEKYVESNNKLSLFSLG